MTKNGSNERSNERSNEVKRLIDGDKLYEDMCARFENLKYFVDSDMNGDPQRQFHQWWELKYWKESLERGAYDEKSE